MELRRAYHVRSLMLHPDRHASAPSGVLEAASRAMAELNRAYAVLRDPESRRLYDASLEVPSGSVTTGATEVLAPARRAQPSRWWRDPAPATTAFVAFA